MVRQQQLRRTATRKATYTVTKQVLPRHVTLATLFAAATALAFASGCGAGKAARHQIDTRRVDHAVSALFAGIRQHGNSLGSPTAPVTLQVFSDLECLTAKHWFVSQLPAIIREFVRTGLVRIQYRSLKTDTLDPRVFVIQQTAALAAGSQDQMWNYVELFYDEQGREYTRYVTERYLADIARQVPNLEARPWKAARDTRLARTVFTDDHTARTLGFHDTPAFLIGPTGGKLKPFSGRTVVVYKKLIFRKTSAGAITKPSVGLMNPVSLVDTQDLRKAVKEITSQTKVRARRPTMG